MSASRSERTRVAFVINDLARAGAETQLVLLATGLDRDRFEPRVILLKERNDFAAPLAEARVPVVALRRRGPGDLGVLLRLRRALRAARPDVVHSWLFFANWMTALVARSSGARAFVLSQRGSYEKQLPPALRRIARWSHARADRLIVNSQAVADEVRATSKLAPPSLVCIPNGTPLPDLGPPLGPDERRELDLPAGRVVLTLGQLSREKGHVHLLQAWPEIRRRHADAVLALVGDGPERAALEALALRLGIASSVTFLGFRSPGSRWLRGAELVVHPSLTEGMPNAVLEAMACARPIVATAVDGVPELVGDTARLVAAADAGALASAVSSLLDDPAQAAALATAARARAESTFSVRSMVEATSAVYDDLLAG